jgi:hypothetical protein
MKLTLTIGLLAFAVTAAAADPPIPRTVESILDQWFTVAVNTWRDDQGRLNVAVCFDGAEQLADREWVGILPQLAALSPYLVNDLAIELKTINKLRPASDKAALRVLVMSKTDWSPRTLKLLLDLSWGQSLQQAPLTEPCPTGRCDCAPFPGDCMTRHRAPNGLPLPCTPPRELCNVTIVQETKWKPGLLW